MLKYFGKDYSYEEIKKRVGNMSQLAGMKKYVLESGRAKGVECVDVRTGAGLNYTILPSRCMDIAWAECGGIPLCHVTATGIVGPQYYEPQGDEWMRSFTAGMLTTCGLDQVGNSCNFKGYEYGLHGRIGNIPAENVNIEEYYDGQDYKMRVSGTVKQVKPLMENIVLHRTIESTAGKNEVKLCDVIENAAYNKQPFMLLYHFNLGFPLLNSATKLYIPNDGISSMNPDLEFDIPNAQNAEDPQEHYDERVFYFKLKADGQGFAHVLAVNDENNPSFGLHFQFEHKELPILAMWKQMSYQDYVIGIEPCNNYVKGIQEASESGVLRYLSPGEKIRTEITLTILTGEDVKERIRYLATL